MAHLLYSPGPMLELHLLWSDSKNANIFKSNPDGANNNEDSTLAPGENGNYRLKKQRSLFSFFKGK